MMGLLIIISVTYFIGWYWWLSMKAENIKLLKTLNDAVYLGNFLVKRFETEKKVKEAQWLVIARLHMENAGIEYK